MSVSDEPSKNGHIRRIDMESATGVIATILTREYPDPMVRMQKRALARKNMETFLVIPTSHAANVLGMIDRQGPNFEYGILLGAAIMACSTSPSGREYLANLERKLKGLTDEQQKTKENAEQPPGADGPVLAAEDPLAKGSQADEAPASGTTRSEAQ